MLRKNVLNKIAEDLTCKKLLLIFAGAMICSFGIYNIHRQTNITEGGVIGLLLLIEHWLGISPGIIAPVLDALCYILALKFLGGRFLRVSVISTISVTLFYNLWELFPPLLPDLSAYPLVAAVAGGVFVGVGIGLIIRQGGSGGGDDALALIISRITKCRLAGAYLITDITVLLLSLSYIPFARIVFSLITVSISSYLVDRIQGVKRVNTA